VPSARIRLSDAGRGKKRSSAPARKIHPSSGIGRIVLGAQARPMGDARSRELSLDAIARDEAWLTVPGTTEGFACGKRGRWPYWLGGM